MGGDSVSWPHQWHIDGQPPDFNSTGAWTRPYLGLHSHLSNHMDPWHDTIATDRSFSVSALAEPPQQRIGYAEPHGWFYCLPNFRQAMFPPPDSFLKKQLLVEPQADIKKGATPNTGLQFPQKQFLVFDQTGDQTTMIFSSGVGTSPVHRLPQWAQNQADASVFHPEHEGSREPMFDSSGTILFDNFIDINKIDEDHESDVQSEMHEDTEELNALMYSDDDADSDDEDEVTSTGHSPSTLTGIEKQYELAAFKEEVASSDEEPIKRRKLSHGASEEAEIERRITVNHEIFSFDEETESHCGNGNGKVCNTEKSISLSGKKRIRKDLVRETVRTLQGIIPGGKGATPIEVIDEAINFLMSLKLKAASLGLDST
ncbi:unnamed protein product [Rhodiola kirilowii]